MPDLGNRSNVMGPQPLGPIKQPPAEMLAAIDRFLDALIAGRKDDAIAMTHDEARDRVSAIADAIAPGAYQDRKVLGKARVAEHYFIKARLLGRNGSAFTLQFRIGPEAGKWTIREAVNLTGIRSAWTK